MQPAKLTMKTTPPTMTMRKACEVSGSFRIIYRCCAKRPKNQSITCQVEDDIEDVFELESLAARPLVDDGVDAHPDEQQAEQPVQQQAIPYSITTCVTLVLPKC